ncbi:hypothetical protein [Streptomyces kanamyceticus]|uniref:Uncharacterized protein n=1 Tax=Streptomyces kanamyceticus TaxID=1967 RepID=A0A5J6GFX7_STRKN|nr:hypothetical protein [Streptomyces kanamyceticus]QEU94830.1 hypothetical protein CP970_31610 [Streptomyces kanamyceticus]
MAGERGDGCDGISDETEMTFTRGVDYVSAWRAAHGAALAINRAAEAAGLDRGRVKAVPHASAVGEAVVWLRPADARTIAAALDARNGAKPCKGGAGTARWCTADAEEGGSVER